MGKLKERLTEVKNELSRERARARLWETMFVAERVNHEAAWGERSCVSGKEGSEGLHPRSRLRLHTHLYFPPQFCCTRSDPSKIIFPRTQGLVPESGLAREWVRLKLQGRPHTRVEDSPVRNCLGIHKTGDS